MNIGAALLVRAWIEIYKRYCNVARSNAALLVRAWIEIFCTYLR